MIGLLKKRNLLMLAMEIMMLAALVLVVMSFTNIQVAQAQSCICQERYRTCEPLPSGYTLVCRYYAFWCCDGYGHCWWDAPCAPRSCYVI